MLFGARWMSSEYRLLRGLESSISICFRYVVIAYGVEVTWLYGRQILNVEIRFFLLHWQGE